MGIDVYIVRENQPEDDAAEWGDTGQGHVGYLRESYHGYPYATAILFPEGFNTDGPVRIPAKFLRARLYSPQPMPVKPIGGDIITRLLASVTEEMNKEDTTNPLAKKLTDVLEKKADAAGAGKQVVCAGEELFGEVVLGGDDDDTKQVFADTMDAVCEEAKNDAMGVPETLSVLDAVALRYMRLYNSSPEEIKRVQQSFIDFVELAERLEKENNEPCLIHVSH